MPLVGLGRSEGAMKGRRRAPLSTAECAGKRPAIGCERVLVYTPRRRPAPCPRHVTSASGEGGRGVTAAPAASYRQRRLAFMCAVPEAEEEDCRTASFLAAEAGVLCCCVRGIARLLIRRRIFLFRFWLLLTCARDLPTLHSAGAIWHGSAISANGFLSLPLD